MGDSCLFHLKTDNTAISFPVSKSEDLNSNPMLLCSRVQKDEDSKCLFHKTEGVLAVGERIYLVTDAIAGWILRGMENDAHPWEALDQAIKMQGGARQLIESLRDAKSIKNDDYTLVWVEASR